MKTLGSIESITQPREGKVGFGSNNRAGRDTRCKLSGSNINDIVVGDNKVGKKDQKMFKSKNLSKSKKVIRLDFLTPGARLAFTKLRQAFVKAPIFHHFNLEHHIWVEINVLSYAISRIFNQLTLDDLG